MRISHRYRFVFLAYPRTASRSVREVLDPYSDIHGVHPTRTRREHPFPIGSTAQGGDFVDPVIEYGRQAGESVTGGYVYRGTEEPDLYGAYLYGDYESGRVWGMRGTTTDAQNVLLADTEMAIASFGEDDYGELYVADLKGAVYRVRVK